jgi:hypothetical protein
MSVSYIVMGKSPMPTNQPAAVFTDIAQLRAYTGVEQGRSLGGDLPERWGEYSVWPKVPTNPARATGGRKKTARRRRTTRKH